MKKILIGIVAIALMACLVGSAFACVGPGLTPGFWKHNVGVYLTSIGTLTGDDAVNGAYSDPGLTGPVATGPPFLLTKDNMGTWLAWLDGAPKNLDMLALYNAMNTKGGGAGGALTRNTAANVFNYWADLFPLP